MSSALDRLRRLQSLRPQRNRPEPTYEPFADEQAVPSRARSGGLEDLIPGEEIVMESGRCYLVTTQIPLFTLRGANALEQLLHQRPANLAPFHPEFGLEALEDFSRAVFVDTETTGLGNGAGIYAFLIGVGTFERVGKPPEGDRSDGSHAGPTHFVVRQFFMRHPGEEPPMLDMLSALVAHRSMTVSFNGRAFDLPLLRSRYAQNQAYLSLGTDHPFALEEPHLDLLLPAQRLWRRRLRSCRLINLEKKILTLERTEEDVPGSLIPSLYVDYLRTGEAGEISRVFYHNREDIVSMVALAHRLIQAYVKPEAAQQERHVDGEEWLSLGICEERRGEPSRAERAYWRATAMLTADGMRAEAYARLGALLKRQERWEEAAAVWQQWLSSIPGADATPFVELAKYCEWQSGDLEQAEMWTAWALHNLQAAPLHGQAPGQRAELQHRLDRIQRKRNR